QAGSRPDIDGYLMGDASQHPALLVELAHADLEFRLKSRESVRIETYLDRYPSLAHDSAIVLDLLEAEYELRRRNETDLALLEYEWRFPGYVEDLRRRLSRTPIPVDGSMRRSLPFGSAEMPTVPGYEILKEIGRGGMGVIYQAKQARLKRHVALKFLPAELVQERALLDRFVREAITASGLNHPNICTIHELGEHAG